MLLVALVWGVLCGKFSLVMHMLNKHIPYYNHLFLLNSQIFLAYLVTELSTDVSSIFTHSYDLS